MQDDTIISGLTGRRRELTGQIEALLSQVEAIAHDVRALDQVMLLFDPEIVPEAIPTLGYRPRPDWAKRGEVQRALLQAMRDAGEPLGCAELTRRVMAVRSVDSGAYALHRKRIARSLDKLRARGLVLAVTSGRQLLWEIVR